MSKQIRVSLLLALGGWALAMPSSGFEPPNAIQSMGYIEYAIAPEHDATGLIVRTIDAAKSQVLVQAFSFTHRDIADALIRAHRRGLDVQIIVDREQTLSSPSSAMRALGIAGLILFTDGEHAAAHNKIIIVDPNSNHPALVTGSFNFTYAAQLRNAENVLVLHDNPDLTWAFYAGWRHHRAHAMVVIPEP